MYKQLFLRACITLMLLPACAESLTLGHVLVATKLHGLQDIVYEQKHGDAVVEGDIILQSLSKLHTSVARNPQALILLRLGGSTWANGLIPFKLSPDLPLATKLAALDAMDILQRNTHVIFIELTSGNRKLYPNYIVFVPVAGDHCSSFVGQQGGEQEIKLSARCNSMRTTHELGHALGLWHEQSRADRDNYIKILWENINEDYRYNFSQHLSDSVDFAEYDYQSIMHYTAYAFSKNGKRTIEPLQENIYIGQRDNLSKKDIIAINAMYPAEYGSSI